MFLLQKLSGEERCNESGAFGDDEVGLLVWFAAVVKVDGCVIAVTGGGWESALVERWVFRFGAPVLN